VVIVLLLLASLDKYFDSAERKWKNEAMTTYLKNCAEATEMLLATCHLTSGEFRSLLSTKKNKNKNKQTNRQTTRTIFLYFLPLANRNACSWDRVGDLFNQKHRLPFAHCSFCFWFVPPNFFFFFFFLVACCCCPTLCFVDLLSQTPLFCGLAMARLKISLAGKSRSLELCP